MANPFTKEAGRAGNKHRPSRKPFRPAETHNNSTSALMADDVAPFWGCSEEETPYDGLFNVPMRRPLGQQQGLEIFRQKIETRTVIGRQLMKADDPKAPVKTTIVSQARTTRTEIPGYGPLVKPLEDGRRAKGIYKTNGTLVTTTDEKLAYKAPKTLLRQGIPDDWHGKSATYKRQTSITKQILTEREDPLPEGMTEGLMIETTTEVVDLKALGIEPTPKK